VVFVATEHDTVYAFDTVGASDKPIWKVSFSDVAKGVTPVPAQDTRCPFIQPEIGITSTPVIDLSSATLYVLARTKEKGKYVQRLHALDIATGREKPNSPVVIAASVRGTGTASVSGKVSFDPLRESPRPALLLASGQVYLIWASSCDVGPYHGWVMAYDAHTLAQTAVLNTTPDGAREESGSPTPVPLQISRETSSWPQEMVTLMWVQIAAAGITVTAYSSCASTMAR
jgi:hypothetical protein